MAKDKTMKALLASIESKETEILRLQAQVEALKEVYNQEAGLFEKVGRKSAVPIKTTVLDLLKVVGADGLNASIACAMAQANGTKLQPKSVSSLLSRFKSDGTVVHDGTKYYLPEFKEKRAEPTLSQVPGVDMLRPLRSSGQSS